MTHHQDVKSLKETGTHYIQFLQFLHDQLRPKTYFEIGTLTGNTLKLSKCKSVAIDPKFSITGDVIGTKQAVHFIQDTSDSFFRASDPASLLGDLIDVVFLDGMHIFEYLLRDFINTERFCKPNSIVLLHDCLPPHPWNALRSARDERRKATENPDWWTGDVWKIIPALRKYRPHLSIHVLDCAPTGLVIITNLDPTSSSLKDSYYAIVEEYVDLDLEAYDFDGFVEECRIRRSSEYDSVEKISKHFWL